MRSEPTCGASKGSWVQADLYADLLGRFERLLAYATTLQARLGRHGRQRGRFERLSRENSRLRARIGLDDIYISLLEQALESAGMLAASGQPAAAIDTGQADADPMAAEKTGSHRLRLAPTAGRHVAP